MAPQAPSVALIAGPTAVGKSALAIALAEAVDGVVINADSMQVYRDLSIVAARPSAADCARVPHRLFGILAPDPPCSVAVWREMALDAVAAAHAAGKRAILVGGTGLYVDAFAFGLSPVPASDPAARAAAEDLLARIGGTEFRSRLAAVDPALAARLKDGDRQRLIRAWEVHAATGRPLSDWQKLPPVPPPFRVVRFVAAPERTALRAAIDLRLRRMVAEGALTEVARLDRMGLDPALPILRAVAVPEFRAVVRGAVKLADGLEAAGIATKQFAKRQSTWFRNRHADAIVLPTAHDDHASGVWQLSQRTKERAVILMRDAMLT